MALDLTLIQFMEFFRMARVRYLYLPSPGRSPCLRLRRCNNYRKIEGCSRGFPGGFLPQRNTSPFQGLYWQLIGGMFFFLFAIGQIYFICVSADKMKHYSEGNRFRLFYLNKLSDKCHISLPFNFILFIIMKESLILY